MALASAGDIQGINVASVTAWMQSHIADLALPLEFDLIAGGH